MISIHLRTSRFQVQIYSEDLGYHLKKKMQARTFNLKKKYENNIDDVDGEDIINNATLKSFAQVLRNSKKTQKLSMDYLT